VKAWDSDIGDLEDLLIEHNLPIDLQRDPILTWDFFESSTNKKVFKNGKKLKGQQLPMCFSIA